MTHLQAKQFLLTKIGLISYRIIIFITGVFEIDADAGTIQMLEPAVV